MARGAQKIQSQERNARKQAQKAKANAAPMTEAQMTADKIQCNICKTFVKRPAKGNYSMAEQHHEAKHPKFDLLQCFPVIKSMREADAAAAAKAAKLAKKKGSTAGGGGQKPAEKKKEKKKKKEDLSFLDAALPSKSKKKKKSKKR